MKFTDKNTLELLKNIQKVEMQLISARNQIATHCPSSGWLCELDYAILAMNEIAYLKKIEK